MAEEEATVPVECDSVNSEEDISSSPSSDDPLDRTAESSGSSDASSTEAVAELTQYAEAVCESVCTCESCEEMHPFGETEDSMHICSFSTHQCPGPGEFLLEEQHFCTCGDGEDDVPVNGRALFALHCCGCGVQLSAMDASDGDGINQNPVHHHHANHNPVDPRHASQNPVNPRHADQNPVGPRHANQNPVDPRHANQNPEISRNANQIPEDLHPLNENAPPHQEPSPQSPAPPPPPPQLPSLYRVAAAPPNPQTPLTMLRVMSCDDGSPADTRLHEVARIGDINALRELLKDERRRENINARVRPFYATPLREAVVGGSRECVEELLSSGAEVDAVDVKGQTPLLVAASLGLPDVMELLLSAGADPEGSRYNNSTPLLLCIREGPVTAVETLLRHNVDPEPLSMLTSCVPGWPLQHSVVYRRFGCFLALLRGGAETSIERVLAKRPRAADCSPEQTRELAQDIVRRISVTRTILKYASGRPEFVMAFHAFGGRFEPLHELPEELRSADTPARRALSEALESPQRLTALCRTSLRQYAGAQALPTLAVQARLPTSLRIFLAYTEFDVYCQRDKKE